jgi:DNA-binding NarL/FixJ family response regulator
MRVVIADDSVLLREGIARILADKGFSVAAKVASADELLRCVEADPPDVAIVDIRMPPTHKDEGLVAAERIRRAGHSSECSSCRNTWRPSTPFGC